MPNVARRTSKRWAYVAKFQDPVVTPDMNGTVDEISDLEAIVEALPDWNTLTHLVITYNVNK